MSAGPVVIKLGGAAIDDARALGPFWDAIATLATTCAGGVVLVHGGGAAVDAHLARLGLTSQRRAGLRVTPDEHIGEVVAVLRGSVNTRLVGLLCARGVAAVGLGLSDGGACVCDKHEPDGVDLGRVGAVKAAASADDTPTSRGGLWRELLAAGRVPVLCSIGLDAGGEPLNVNADDAASAVAAILHASMLVLLTDVPGVLDADGSLIESTDHDGIESRIADGTIAGGMIPKARAAVASAEASGVPTVIASWKDLDGFASLGAGGHPGTRITARRRRPAGTHA